MHDAKAVLGAGVYRALSVIRTHYFDQPIFTTGATTFTRMHTRLDAIISGEQYRIDNMSATTEAAARQYVVGTPVYVSRRVWSLVEQAADVRSIDSAASELMFRLTVSRATESQEYRSILFRVDGINRRLYYVMTRHDVGDDTQAYTILDLADLPEDVRRVVAVN